MIKNILNKLKKATSYSLIGILLFTSIGFNSNNTYADYGEYIVYTNYSDGDKLYRKNANDTGNGTAITSVSSSFPIYSPDGNYIVYRNNNDGSKLYRKNANDTGNGTAITSVSSSFQTYSPDGNYIVYRNNNDGSKLYRKNANDTGNGTAITSVGSSFPTHSPDGNYIVYTNMYDGGKLYRKNANDTGDGTAITSVNSNAPTYSPDGNYIVYRNVIDGGKLYIKNANDTGDGTAITSVNSNAPIYSPDGNYIVYRNNNDGGKLYRKNANDTGNGSTINNVDSGYPTYSTSVPSLGNANGDYTHYILNRLTATEGNMQYLNNTTPSVLFSNYNSVKSNFVSNYNYKQSWYENKGLTTDVINNNVKWDEGVIFSKTDVAGGSLAGYKLSATYSFMSYRETDNHDSNIFWRTNLENTSFQSDTTWNNVGIPAYPIENGSGNVIAYLQFPCGNLICKDQYCSEVKKLTNLQTVNEIPETTIGVDPLNPTAPYCGDQVKNTMDEECDGNDGIRHNLNETCNNQCKVETSPGVAPGCPSYSALGYSCNGATSTPIFYTPPANIPPTPIFNGFGLNKNTTYTGQLTASDPENDTLSYASVSSSVNGVLNINSNGSFTYTPNLGYVGTDTFTYSVSDGVNTPVNQIVNIIVNDVVVSNNPPTPIFNGFVLNQNNTYTGQLTASDPENDTLSFISINNPVNGAFNINSNGSFTYTPNLDYNGTDTFTYAVSDGFNTPVNQLVNITINPTLGGIINWTPPTSVPTPDLNDININTGMTNNETVISNDIVCSSTQNGTNLNKSIIVTNTMANLSFINKLENKADYIKNINGSSSNLADKIIQKKLKSEKLNIKSSIYDLGANGQISGIQFNLTKIPNSAVMRKLVNLAIDHSTNTMANYNQTVKDYCLSNSNSNNNTIIPAGFIEVNDKNETILNLFRYNGN